MALGRQGDRQGDLVVTWRELSRSPGYDFYDRRQRVLIEANLDAFAEASFEVLRGEDVGAVDSAEPVLPDPHNRLVRGFRLRAWN